jgi:hypothetical protein
MSDPLFLLVVFTFLAGFLGGRAWGRATGSRPLRLDRALDHLERSRDRSHDAGGSEVVRIIKGDR